MIFPYCRKPYSDAVSYTHLERLYWERQGVKFNIVTRDDMLPFRIQIKNIAFLLRFWDEKFIVNQEQKLLYLIAHHIVEIPLSDQFKMCIRDRQGRARLFHRSLFLNRNTVCLMSDEQTAPGLLVTRFDPGAFYCPSFFSITRIVNQVAVSGLFGI